MRLTMLSMAILVAIPAMAEEEPLPIPEVMLAQTYGHGVKINDYWYSEKLDGIRAYWTGTQLLTRNGNRIFAPKWFVEALPPMALDGELWAGRGNFHIVQQTVLDTTPDEHAWKQIDFMVFDLPESAGDYQKRYYTLIDLVKNIDAKHIKFVEHKPIVSEAQLFEKLDAITGVSGEGVMLRNITSRYQAGRGSDLLKLKKYSDAEAMVIGYKPGSGRLMGMLGALLVRLDDGTEFYIGSGFTDEQRKNPPAIGATVTYRHNGFTNSGKPKFARYLRERLPE
ncbi:DNA ligase [Vibrio vulnificus]|nr:DNA ligase [Vibrio vulnificus]EJC6820892.1 DNA ligase [Vibrio vulnificus]EJC6954713.1 DNA ligase [Vibrio vulnificus]EJC6959206.1 DNA ligase [Vibrio vulnificus]EKQ3695606.1 DNA ligase [Vibrio vulnificus]